ncbi:MAG: acyloxyacyl hydrolase [Bacteroidota bacterium]
MRALWILVYILSVGISPQLKAQDRKIVPSDKDQIVFLGLKSEYGFIIPHSEELKPVSETNPWGISIDVSRMRLSDKAWNNCNCYSKVGFSFSYINFGNPQELGNSYSLRFFLEPLITYKSRLYTTMRLGIGATYLNRVFDEVDNPRNTFYSSVISFPLFVALSANYNINKSWHLNLNANYNHISNGGINQPNRGINYPTISLGLDYLLRPRDFPVRDKTKDNNSYKWRPYVGLFGTTRSVDDTDESDRRRLTIGLNGGLTRKISRIYGVNIGLEASYDGSHDEKNDSGGDYNTFIFSVMAGHSLNFGRYEFSQQFGLYLDSPDPNDRIIFQRYALDYHISPNIKAGFSLKAHGHVAQNIDLRVGYIF